MKQISWVAAGGLAGVGGYPADGRRPVPLPRGSRGAAALVHAAGGRNRAAVLGAAAAQRRGRHGRSRRGGTDRGDAAAGDRVPAAACARAWRFVSTANLLAGQASERAVVRLVRRKRVDVLFLQELTGRAATRLEEAGLTELLPHEMIDARDSGSRGSGIYARFRSAADCPCGRPSWPSPRPGWCCRPGSAWNSSVSTIARRACRCRGATSPAGGRSSGPAAPRGSSALPRLTSTPPSIMRSSAGYCARSRRRRRPDGKRPDPHLGTGRETSAPHDRSCPRRSPLRRAGRLDPPRAGQ